MVSEEGSASLIKRARRVYLACTSSKYSNSLGYSSGTQKRRRKRRGAHGNSLKTKAFLCLLLAAAIYAAFTQILLPSLWSLSPATSGRGGKKSKYKNTGFDVDPALKVAHTLPWEDLKAIIRPHKNYKKAILTPGKTKLPRKVTRPAKSKKRRSFGCIRDGCRGLAIEDLLDRDWSMRFKSGFMNGTHDFKTSLYTHVTFVLTDTTTLTQMRAAAPEMLDKIIRKYEGSSYVTAFEGGDAIGGNKGQQLRTKSRFARRHHCKYNDLGVQPPQYRLYVASECKDLLKLAETNPTLTWLLKPETGSQGKGITFHQR